ncbi:MAG TPA: hypothetical protein VI636_05660 [Candidatus Angelobacter sp.]
MVRCTRWRSDEICQGHLLDRRYLCILAITPLYFLFDRIGQQDPPPITHPGFYYGFAGVAFAWQIAFCVIATGPARFRPLMIPSVLEKLGFGIAIVVLYLQQRVHPADLVLGAVDLLFALLFLISFARTKSSDWERA